jgi:hypothetical protein
MATVIICGSICMVPLLHRGYFQHLCALQDALDRAWFPNSAQLQWFNSPLAVAKVKLSMSAQGPRRRPIPATLLRRPARTSLSRRLLKQVGRYVALAG